MAKATKKSVTIEVYRVLAGVSALDVAEINDTDDLKKDLGLGANLIKSLAGTWTKISKYFGGKSVTLTEAGKCKKVKDVIDLVWGKVK